MLLHKLWIKSTRMKISRFFDPKLIWSVLISSEASFEFQGLVEGYFYPDAWPSV